MKKIIVTGGAGYIGSHTVVALIEAGYQPVIIDNLSNSDIAVIDRIADITAVRPQIVVADLRDKEATDRFFEQHSDAIGVIHFAALKAVGESVAEPLRYYDNNLNGLTNVLKSMLKQQIANVIFSSSATVYGQPEVLPATEESPTLPAESPYGATKQMGEVILRDFIASVVNTRGISLRYFNPIGAHDSSLIGELPLGVPNNLMPFITQTAAGIREELSVFGADYDTRDGTAVRDYIHVVDIAEAHVVAMERLIVAKSEDRYEVFNLGTGQGSTVLEVIQSFERTTGVPLNYRTADRRPGDVEAVYAATTKAAEVMGWKARYNLDDMTRSAWAWQERLGQIDIDG